MSDVPDLADWDRSDPDPWLALWMDRSLPIASAAKAALVRDQRSRSRQFLLPIVRPFAADVDRHRQLVHTVTPRCRTRRASCTPASPSG